MGYDINFDEFDFTITAGAPEVRQHDYEGAGYNTSRPELKLGEEVVPSITCAVIASRKWKTARNEVTGEVHTLPIWGRVPPGCEKPEYRVQVLIMAKVGDEWKPFIFGARSWTARAFWTNPGTDSKWHSPQFPVGVLTDLDAMVSAVKKNTGHVVPTYCWVFRFAPAQTPIIVGSGQKSESYPLVHSAYKKLDNETIREFEQFYIDEEIDVWKDSWKKGEDSDYADDSDVVATAPAPQSNGSAKQEDYSEFDIPF